MDKQQSKYFQTAVKMDEAFLRLLEKKDFEYITVKEICAQAGVNRSTFYLHYETIGQLLEESVDYVNGRFREHMEKSQLSPLPLIFSCSENELIFITSQYLLPYLEFVRDNRRLFGTMLKRAVTLRLDKSYAKMAKFVFVPILKRFNVPEQEREYTMRFYISGLMAVITGWIETECADDIESVAAIMERCVLAKR